MPLRAQYTPGVTVAGGNGSGSTANQFSYPVGLWIDGNGTIYVADTGNNRIQKWASGTSSGVTVAGGNGSSGTGANQLYLPEGAAVDGAGNVYVSDKYNNRVQKWAPGANSGVTVAGSNGQGAAANQLNEPWGIFVDGVGNIYVVDRNNDRVQKWAPGASSGVTVAGGNGKGTAANQLNYPAGVFVDATGTIYVADASNNRIQKWAPGASSGVTVAGGNGGGAAANQIYFPTDVKVDKAGNIYVADFGNERIQKWAPGATSGVTVAGGNGKGTAANQFDQPYSLGLDGAGNLYVADFNNARVQKFTPILITITSQPSAASSVCVGNTVSTTVGISHPAPQAYQWYKDNPMTPLPGQTSATLSLTNVQSGDAGNYWVVVTGSINSLTSTAFQLTVNALPPVTLTSSGQLNCATPTVMLTATPVLGATYAFSSGATQVIGSNTATVTQAGMYSVVVTSAQGCAASATTDVGGSSDPPSVSASVSGTISCANPLVTLTATPASGVTYAFSSGATQVNNGNTATVSQAGTYSVVVTAANSCTALATVDVSGSGNPPSVSLSASSAISCANPTVTLTASPISGANYAFSIGASQIEGGNTATVSQAGTYSVVVSSAGGCSSSATVSVTGTSNPPGVSLSAGGAISCTTPGVTLTATPVSGASYAFSSGATQVSGGNTATVTAAGVYSVTLTREGCTNTASVTVAGGLTPSAAPNLTSLTVLQGTPNATLTASNCSGTLSWTGPGSTTGTGPISVSTSTVGVFTYSATCSVGVCTSPATSVTVLVKTPALPAKLSVSHWDADYNQPTNNVIRPYLQLQNTGTTSIAYGDITIRYWLTVEEFSPLTNLSVYWAQLGTDKVRMKYVELAQPRQGALGYIEYSFDASAGNLAAGNNSGPIQNGIGKQNWTAFNESDDHSYKNTTSFTQNNRITAYVGGQLVWGNEPAPADVTPIGQRLKVYSQTNSSSTTNTLSTYVQVRNEGNVPLAYSTLTVRYYFTADGTQPLNFYLDYAQLGNNLIKGTFGKLSPAVGKADTYLELSFTGAGTLYPLSTTGSIQYRIAKSDWSSFNQTNDHSYKPAGPMIENGTMTAYLNGVLVYGSEPSTASARIASAEAESTLQAIILGNPVRGDAVEVEVRGAGGQPLQLRLTDMQGHLIQEHQVSLGEAVERHRLSVAGQSPGLLLLQVSTPNQVKSLKVIKTE